MCKNLAKPGVHTEDLGNLAKIVTRKRYARAYESFEVLTLLRSSVGVFTVDDPRPFFARFPKTSVHTYPHQT